MDEISINHQTLECSGRGYAGLVLIGEADEPSKTGGSRRSVAWLDYGSYGNLVGMRVGPVTTED
jgi:hypothetical protein